MQIHDVKKLAYITIDIAAVLVAGGALVGHTSRLLARQYPTLTEAAYFLAGCGLLLWALQ